MRHDSPAPVHLLVRGGRGCTALGDALPA